MIRIAITGPESTGKTSMVKYLSNHYSCPSVPEFAREYLAQINRPYTAFDIEAIARRQLEMEDAISPETSIFFCDTDLLVCRIWMEVVFGYCQDWLLLESKKTRYAHTLLMNIDLPWQSDPLREHPLLREELFERYKMALVEDQRSFSIISGINEERFENAQIETDRIVSLLKHF